MFFEDLLPVHQRNVISLLILLILIYHLINSYKLIKEKINVFTCGDLYFLCIIIMLHDVGNIEGRENHQIKITDIYNDIRNSGIERQF